jgi:hypothetical protein
MFEVVKFYGEGKGPTVTAWIDRFEAQLRIHKIAMDAPEALDYFTLALEGKAGI